MSLDNQKSRLFRKSFLAVCGISILLILISMSCFFYFKKPNVVFIDASRVLQEYKGSKTARAKFEEKAHTWQSNIDTLQHEFDLAYKKFESEYDGLSEGGRAQRKEALNKQRGQLEQYKSAMGSNASQEDQKNSQEIILEINRFLEEYGKAEGYDLILIANQVGTIAYGKKELDLTDDVIKALNESYEQKN